MSDNNGNNGEPVLPPLKIPEYHPLAFDFKSHHFLEAAATRIPKELGCAFTASFLVSPLVSIIDKAIVQEISSISSLTKSMLDASKEMVFKPKTFFSGLSFRLTFAVYFGTYAVANLSEAALDFVGQEEEKTRKFYKVGAASIANVSLLAWRDSIFARAFSGPGSAPPKSTPVRTVGLFATRDTVTMAATFWAAPKACNYLVNERNWDRHTAEITTSLSIPVCAQFMTAPIHIHALDYFNRPNATTAERIVRIQEEMGKVCFARGLRILPAFGIGSYSNNKFRELFIKGQDEELLFKKRVVRRLTEMGVQRRLTEMGERFQGRKTEKPIATSAKRE